MSEILKWYRYDMDNYQPFFKVNCPIKDKPLTIYHLEKHDKFIYLDNIYSFVLCLDDTNDFFKENAEYHLRNPKYPSRTVDFFGNDGIIESYFLKDGKIDCLICEIVKNRKNRL